MEKHLCINGTLDDAKYSAPMPVIGLYIAGATLVCFLFMIYDILHGFWRRKPWLPCHLFSLNSLTLTLLSIATKLPVDLTTSMPSALDQLSKLTGTALICISMGFFMPSIGIMSHKEGFGNMASLTILVVAVVVNVSIQMATGVIFSFIVEHIIILFCMLVLLMVLWCSMSSINLEKTTFTDRNRELILKGTAQTRWSSESGMLQRLRMCYVHSYSSNPQFVFFQTSNCVFVGMLCTVCSVVLSVAVLRSLAIKELKFCKGVSDYRWSTKMVVVTQIFTILAGSLAIGFRWLTFVNHLDSRKLIGNFVIFRPVYYEISTLMLHLFAIWFSNPSFMKIFRLLEVLVRFVVILILTALYMTSQIVLWSSLKAKEFFAWAMSKIKNCYSFFINKDLDGEAVDSMNEELQMTEEFGNVVYSVNRKLKNWSLGISVKDMDRWMKENEKRDSPNNLVQLLLKIPPSQQSLAYDIQHMGHSCSLDDQDTEYIFGLSNSYRVSCLSILVLVLVATISLPSTLSGSLIQILDEVFEIIYFIDKKMNDVNLVNQVTWMLAKDVWTAKDIMNYRFQKKKITGQTDLECAFEIIDKLRNYDFILLDPEVKIVTDFIKNREYTSVEELYNYIEQLLVDMLHLHLLNFPRAIFKDVVESPAEECEVRVRRAMKFVCKLESLDAHFQWSFPDGSTHLPIADTHGNQC